MLPDKPQKVFEFVGPSYTSQSVNVDAQRCINLYVETDETGQGKSKRALYGSPGIQLFCTLPTAPVRGVYATDAGRLFVVAGAKYYEVHSNGTYTDRGDVGADDGLPVFMSTNLGGQIMIVASGKVWIDDGLTIEQAQYANGTGTVTASGTAVTWISGSKFDSSNVGNPMVIGGTTYTVASVTDDEHLVLTASAGSVPGTTVTGTVDVTGTAVTRASGTYFNPNYLAVNGGPGKCTIAGTVYEVSTVPDGSNLTLVSPGLASSPLTAAAFSLTYGVDYSASYPVQGSFGAFLDGYFIAAKYPSRQFNISAINNGKSWTALDYAMKEGSPDGIVGLLADHEELWVFGSLSIEVWQDTGAASFPFQRNPNGFIPVGCRALGSITRVAAGVGWLGSDTRGGCVAYIAQGFIPVRVSTYAVETAWEAYPDVDDARAYSYVDGGHQFWVISFPTAFATWVYDATEKLWHERAWYNADAGGGPQLEHQRGNTHAYIALWNEHIVGDRDNGKLYRMGRFLHDDDGVPIYRIRSAPHISNSTLWQYYAQFRLDMHQAFGGTPNVSLTWSDDGGTTWRDAISAPVQASMAIWRRLGKSRDRVFKVIYSGGGEVVWIDAHLDHQQGLT